MPQVQSYHSIQQFLLFKGMSQSELMQVLACTRFDFFKVEKGKTIVDEGDDCNSLLLVTNGLLEVTTYADDRGYSMIEKMTAPFIFQPECIYGAYCKYRSRAVALTDVNIIAINKQEVIMLSERFLIFRINLLNLFATSIQKMLRVPWMSRPKTLRGRIIRFVLRHCSHPAGHKVMMIHMERLAQEINEGRLGVSKELNLMESQGLLVLRRGRIEIPQLERLLT